ncbi:ABC transporter ATP-binding protein [Alkalihalobacillus sp. AL-G]|uniref:ABC transporter ATP-binding protein n=1 Tax=Alkalihalobacillus sp. AL-G TaxID=2926399 RepID=UPI00272B4255|nr:ABC transporter ATP-binding protein [Alkalihalobacillus sp. AL-G]WLD94208.1 ABC transporter ATP-binding protein [Alkalihalobacillus sp. AL-G]
MSTVIQVDNITKSYGDTKAVQGISFTVQKGEVFGIIGPNGAGKTTTIEMLEGIRKPDNGKIDVLGLEPSRQLRELNKLIGVQFQATSIPKKMKVSEALDLFESFYPNNSQKGGLIEQLGLQEKLNDSFENLSGGWKQRVTLALATLHQPEIVFLDEPSMGLDPHARRELWSMIHLLKEQGCTIVVTTHYMEEAEKLCDRVAMIYGGQLKALDTPRQLLDEMTVNYLSFQSDLFDYDGLLSLPSVIRVEHDHDTYKVYSEKLQQTAYHIFNYCHEKEIEIRNFKFEKGTLDDLFVHYLKKEETA